MERRSSFDFISALRLVNRKLKHFKEKNENPKKTKPVSAVISSINEKRASTVRAEVASKNENTTKIVEDSYRSPKIKKLSLINILATKIAEELPSSQITRPDVDPLPIEQKSERVPFKISSLVSNMSQKLDFQEAQTKIPELETDQRPNWKVELQKESTKIINTEHESNSSKDSKDSKKLSKKYKNELKLRKKFEAKCKELESEKNALLISLGSTRAQLASQKSAYEFDISQLTSQTAELRADVLHLTKKNEALEKKLHKILQAEKKTEREKRNSDFSGTTKCVHEASELYLKTLAMADELFEKNNEIKALRAQQSELFKEKVNNKIRDFELDELREHIHSLLNTIQNLKLKIETVMERCKSKDENENVKHEDILKSMEQMNESIDKTLVMNKSAKYKDFKEFFNSNSEEFKNALKVWLAKQIRLMPVKKEI